jgi:hypothetical protein
MVEQAETSLADAAAKIAAKAINGRQNWRSALDMVFSTCGWRVAIDEEKSNHHILWGPPRSVKAGEVHWKARRLGT